MSDQSKTIKIKPSFIPYVWKGLTLTVLGVIVYAAVSAIPLPLPLPFPASGTLAIYAAGALITLGLLGVLVGAVRRNMFTYLISDRDMVYRSSCCNAAPAGFRSHP